MNPNYETVHKSLTRSFKRLSAMVQTQFKTIVYLDYLPVINKHRFIWDVKVNKYGYKEIYYLYNNTVGVWGYTAPKGKKINER